MKRPHVPADLTGALVFLASPEAEFVTGQTLNANGGASHHRSAGLLARQASSGVLWSRVTVTLAARGG